jgi:hypothetical protein
VSNLTTGDVALIACDPNGSNIDPSTVVSFAGELEPQAIVLYSLYSQACNLTPPYNYSTIYSLTSPSDSRSLFDTVSTTTSPPITAMIGNNATSTTSPNSQPSSTSNDGAPAPTTAVAMSILYSITGIITLLFLVIIATGAIRAHRHPERYGPRNGFSGRPRQSRAKGLTRAMLETLPMVKFGDPEPAKPGSRDIELQDGNSSVHNAPIATTATGAEVAEDRSKSPAVVAAAVESGMGPAQAESVHSGQEVTPRDGELGCSICTEDFTTGEDVRVLPCQHKYHPNCIDPWLLNVSGTCPLWYVFPSFCVVSIRG